jgi:hypothetical protein
MHVKHLAQDDAELRQTTEYHNKTIQTTALQKHFPAT